MKNNQALGLVGNLNVDLIMGPIPNLPEWEQEVLAKGMETRFAGTVGYMAMAAKALGITSIPISTVGRDFYGQYLLEELVEHELPTEGIDTLDLPTPLTVVNVGPNGKRAMVSVLGAHNSLDLSIYMTKRHLISNCREIFICGSYLLPKLDCKAARLIAEDAHNNGQLVYFDPSWDPTNWSPPVRNDTKNLLHLVDVFMMNTDEICGLMGTKDWKLAGELAAELGPQEVVVKRGKFGAAAFIAGIWYEADAYPVESRDTTGAGDVFDIAYLWARREGFSPRKRLEFSNAAASIIVSQKSRTEYPSVNNIQKILNSVIL